MGENERDIFLHDWVIDEIKFQYSKEFNEIQINKHGVEVNDIQGQFPDIIFANYGQVVMLGEVEVESTINDNSIEKWKNNMSTGISLISSLTFFGISTRFLLNKFNMRFK